MDLRDFSKKVYGYFSNQIYKHVGGPKFNYGVVNSANTAKIIDKFVLWIEETYGAATGADFVWFYVAFQYGRFELCKFRSRALGVCNGQIMPTSIFGTGAIKKFEDRRTIDELTMRSKWILEYKSCYQRFFNLFLLLLSLFKK